MGLAAVGGGLYAMGMLRAEYIAWEENAPIDLNNMIYLLLVNVVALATGVLMAYLSHDADRDLERIFAHKQLLRRRADRLWRRWRRLASEFDLARAEAICETERIHTEARSKLMEYREYNHRYRRDRGGPAWFAREVGDRFFRPRDFAAELDRTPQALDEVLRKIDNEMEAVQAGVGHGR